MNRLNNQINGRQKLVLFFFVLGLCGIILFIHNAQLKLTFDDISLLRGGKASVFDEFRYIPRLLMTAMYSTVGPNPVAALTINFLFHFVNVLLVFYLCQDILTDSLAAKVSACVIMINPLTLKTLTWIASFSYIIGTSFALLALILAWHGCQPDNAKHILWKLAALIFYCAALLCIHVVLFLPFIFLLFAWLRGDSIRLKGLMFFGSGLIVGVLIYFFVYGFGRYGIDDTSLFNTRFISAFISSALSFGFSMSLAYPLSFIIKSHDFLRFSFSEPVRWIVTILLLIGSTLHYRSNETWRLWLALSLSFVALITPYIIRVYMLVGEGNYHFSFILTGRLFYTPFTIIAMGLGGIVAQLYRRYIKTYKGTVLLLGLAFVAYCHALFVLYDATDFLGFNIVRGMPQKMPLPWNPYANNQSIWLAGCFIVVSILIGVRFLNKRFKKNSYF